MKDKIKQFALPAFVLLVGSLQTFGYLSGIEGLRKIGQLTAASPLPLVFSSFRGLETFSPRFALEVRGSGTRIVPMTKALYSELDGPYNRRNVYGAAFAFGAVLANEGERELVSSVLTYGLCPGGPIRSLLDKKGLTHPSDSFDVLVHPKGHQKPVKLEVRCKTS
jgi:hypothetical protein